MHRPLLRTLAATAAAATLIGIPSLSGPASAVEGGAIDRVTEAMARDLDITEAQAVERLSREERAGA
ncbi:hypothetical protein GCM10023347_13600 [Streptomyces chumphonensis]|uniref:Uncharacterized protein n=1 Tax=Streptomyces chumphonensis TaxID=1214925 RepID=A0A927F070_9ACTN|nr:hypothetical protein [Streptomyces chumphonensis]MBD3932262.1 hypothetical protein [Streptomyces chumphonensis]